MPDEPKTSEQAGESKAEPKGEASGTSDRKERVLHTRVPAVLEQELKRLAENIRVPVSNLVRAILEDAVEVADRAGRGVEHELQRAATTLSKQRATILSRVTAPTKEPTPLDQVIGFQTISLAVDARCARCDRALDAGEEAHLGIGADATAPRVVVCDKCVPRKGKRD
jgi:hypothetical protein